MYLQNIDCARDTEFNNTFVPPTPPTPVFQPEKFDLSVEKYDITQINY